MKTLNNIAAEELNKIEYCGYTGAALTSNDPCPQFVLKAWALKPGADDCHKSRWCFNCRFFDEKQPTEGGKMKIQKSKYDRRCDFCGGLIYKGKFYGNTHDRKACIKCIDKVRKYWRNA